MPFIGLSNNFSSHRLAIYQGHNLGHVDPYRYFFFLIGWVIKKATQLVIAFQLND